MFPGLGIINSNRRPYNSNFTTDLCQFIESNESIPYRTNRFAIFTLPGPAMTLELVTEKTKTNN